MIGFAVAVGAQSARAGIPARIEASLAESGITRQAARAKASGATAPAPAGSVPPEIPTTGPAAAGREP